MSRPTLIVMARFPKLAHGKSRLAAEIGKVEALRINRLLHARAMRTARDPRWRTLLAVTPDRDVGCALPGVWPADVRRIAQGRGDLGARMTRAMAGNTGPVALIGTDCPAMTRADIAAAFAALRREPAAIGPARDGGFWIVAARRARDIAAAFAGVRWSTAHAMADVLAQLRVPVLVLRTLGDVDTLDDWRRRRPPGVNAART
jgi:hypothetical protein